MHLPLLTVEAFPNINGSSDDRALLLSDARSKHDVMEKVDLSMLSVVECC